MPVRRVIRWSLPPLALIALAGALTLSAAPRLAPADASPQAAAGMVPARGPAAAPPNAAGPGSSAAAVQKFVAQKNSENGDRERFVHEGWKLVQTAPPDAQLVGLDPSLLREGREQELRVQMASTSASPGDAANLGAIARAASEEPTRVAAVEALGRIRSEGAQDQLLGLLKDLPEGTMARSQVAPLLHPRDLSDARAATLAGLLDSHDLTPVERQQIAFTLALVGLRDQSDLPQEVAGKLSSDSRALLAQMSDLARLKK